MDIRYLTEEHYRALRAVQFDYVFRIAEDGEVLSLPSNVTPIYAPNVFADEETDIDIQAMHGDEWEALTDYSGQDRYHGAVLHPSEYLGGGLARDILSEPGVYTVTTVETDDPDNPAGWCVLKLTTSDKPLDVWLRFITAYDDATGEAYDEAEAEANIYLDDDRYRVDWYLNSVGLVKHQTFDTYAEARAWLIAEGFDDYSA